MNTEIKTITKRSPKSHGSVKERVAPAGILRAMKTLNRNLRRLKTWHVVYALVVLAALGSSPEALADDEREYLVDMSMDTAAEINLDEARWTYSKSLRIELVKSDHVRVETTIPLVRLEEPRLTLGFNGALARNWSVNLSLWTSL